LAERLLLSSAALGDAEKAEKRAEKNGKS